MIIGIGIDLVDITRIKIISKKNSNFLKKIFTKNEILYCGKKKTSSNCFAKRFAAKEAFVKAIGEGFRDNINFINIEIKNSKKGKPFIYLSKKIISKIKKKLKINNLYIYLSISDEKKYAIANVVITNK
tara:strand:+ start:394 stop:780 length:387 start_codon:yes stop_codon:yes gene_type:complete